MRDFSELELDSELLQAIEEVGYDRPTVVQAQAIPHALDGRDILASAPTGTGKTAAFLLPMLQHLQDFPRKKPGACARTGVNPQPVSWQSKLPNRRVRWQNSPTRKSSRSLVVSLMTIMPSYWARPRISWWQHRAA